MKTGPFQLILSAAASLDPHIYGEHECECARACVCAYMRACASLCAAHTGHLGVHVLSGTTLPGCLELGEFSFKPELLLGHPPRPTGGDDVCSLVARQVPRLPLPFIDRSGRSDVSSRTFGSAAPAETAPTPAPASPPPGRGGNEIKATGEGPGRLWDWGAGDSELPSLSWSI